MCESGESINANDHCKSSSTKLGWNLNHFLEMVLFWEKSRPFVVDNDKLFSWNDDISPILTGLTVANWKLATQLAKYERDAK